MSLNIIISLGGLQMTEQKINELENALLKMEDDRDGLQILLNQARDLLLTIEQQYEEVEKVHAYLNPKDTKSLIARKIQTVRSLLDVTNRYLRVEMEDTEQ